MRPQNTIIPAQELRESLNALRIANDFSTALAKFTKRMGTVGRALVESGQPADALVAYREGIAVAEAKGDKRAAQEMIAAARSIEENAKPGEALSHSTQQETLP